MQESKEIYDRLREILGGQESVKLYLEFLKRNNKTDMLILKNTKAGQAPLDMSAVLTRFIATAGLAGGALFCIPRRAHSTERIYAFRNDLRRLPT